VPAVSLAELRPSCAPRRVAAARNVQLDRFGAHTPTPTNSAMGPEQLRRFCAVDTAGRGLFDTAFERLGLSALDRVLKVARTIADLAGSDAIRAAHLAEAIQYRSLDRRVVG
jgi:magnesium chelatase family protein